MTAFEDNQSPYLTLLGSAAPGTPAAGQSKLYVKADKLLYWKDDAGVEHAASGMTNPMTTQGDSIYGGAAGAPTRLPIGTAAQVWTVNAGATAPAWATPAASTAAFVGSKAYSTVLQSIPAATMTAVAFANEEYDTSAFHDLVTSNTRLTIPAGKAGYYRLTGYLYFVGLDANTTTIVQFLKNATTTLRSQVTPSVAAASTSIGVINTTVVLLAAADYVELRAWQNSAAAKNIGDTANVEQQNFFAAELLGT